MSVILDSPQKITFGLIGNIGNRLKGLHVALKALSLVKNQLPHFELRVLGQGDASAWTGEIERLGLDVDYILSAHASKIETWSQFETMADAHIPGVCPTNRRICR